MLIAEDTSTMTEFEKFVFFVERNNHRKELAELYRLVTFHGGMNHQKFFPKLKKEFGINAKQWWRYFGGKDTLPGIFIYRFRMVFAHEISRAKKKKSEEDFNAMLDRVRLTLPSRLAQDPNDKDQAEATPMANPA